jgi:hypothetical protein
MILYERSLQTSYGEVALTLTDFGRWLVMGDQMAIGIEVAVINAPREANRSLPAEHPTNRLSLLRAGQIERSLDTSGAFLPSLSLHTDFPREDVRISKGNGHEDVVTASRVKAGESLEHFLKRMHPSLTDKQLKKEVGRTLAYNKQYGNDIGDGTHLQPNQQVYLTSVKVLDASGRVTEIESPNGRRTEICYGADGRVASYQIEEANGKISTRAQRTADGQLHAYRCGRSQILSEVQVDAYGNITDTDLNGNKITHLSRGEDVFTQNQNDRPVETTVYRPEYDDGGASRMIATSTYHYTYAGDKLACYVTYPDRPNQRLLLDWANYSDRLLVSRKAAGFDAREDLPADDLVASNLQQRALVRRALTLAHVTPTDGNIDDVCMIVDHESSWDPKAINLWDDNAKEGHPSQGLMQTIAPTFAEYALPGYDKNITDPLSNLIAGIRYAVRNYGSLDAVPGIKNIHASRMNHRSQPDWVGY